LIERVPSLIAAAAADCGADLFIIACNTASTLALDHTRRRVGVEVVGVVPAIKPAAALTKTRTIGLLATPNTVARPYTDQLIADFAQGVQVIRHGAVGLAACAEAMLSGQPIDETCVAASVKGLFAQDGGDKIDVVVLACTHYPHLKTQLAAHAPFPVNWIDSGTAIAQRARQCLGLTDLGDTDLHAAFTTGGNDNATRLGLLRWGFATAECLPSLAIKA
jgi:glutamate racemase